LPSGIDLRTRQGHHAASGRSPRRPGLPQILQPQPARLGRRPLHGLVDVELSSRIDSFKGGIRSTFAAIPDAPVSRFVLEMQGGKKGLIVNSTNLCASVNRATARLTGQNGRQVTLHPAMQPSGCAQQSKKPHGKRRR
jgi:hypothetical protein